ncbi:outer-membrane lipoprotein carrier protein LolA [Spirochaetia bacterium 38H-sp]|uniref:Outer-membrane lipoprotein carrier protein LolA n=1 Tax=Rarispira pelagica TaxID=3141764 RepID=A0ABU9U9F4_9SPIR
MFLFVFSVFSQDVVTAEDFFSALSDRYAQLKDYVVDIVITKEDDVMKGTLYYKHPDRLRIDFSEPEDQVIVANRKELYIYVPSERIVLQQTLSKGSSLSVVTSKGLSILDDYYYKAYLFSPDYVPLDEDTEGNGASAEQVIKLKLTWKTTDVGYRSLVISVAKDGYIRRIEGVTIDYEKIQFDFINLRANQNIPESRFEYETPASANVYYNFLFDSE